MSLHTRIDFNFWLYFRCIAVSVGSLKLRPLNIFLRRREGPVDFVREGEREVIECVTFGSKPDPSISWFREKMKIYDSNIKEVRTKNQTISSLPMVPNLSDQGVTLGCRVHNPLISDATLEATVELNVHYLPKVKLKKGLGLDPGAVREGADFFLECGVRSNPPAYKISWIHQGKEIFHNLSSGIIISNQTLVLQEVGRKSAGIYQCKAINLHGNGESNQIKLNVLYSPVCALEMPTYIEVLHKATANITCTVDAQPQNATFKWQFNSSGGIIEIENDRFSTSGNKSVLPYTPASPGDYGLLLCFARNEIGKQTRPCIINVTAAEPPKLLTDCLIQNETSHSLFVICSVLETKLQTSFKMEVRNYNDLELVTSVQNKTPSFLATGLLPGTAYMLHIFSTTEMGSSEPVKLRAFTVKTAEKRMDVSKPKDEERLGLTAVVAGIVVALLLSIGIMIVLVFKLCPIRAQILRPSSPSQEEKYTQKEPIESESSVVEDKIDRSSKSSGDGSPDLIQVNNDGQIQLQELRVPKQYDIKSSKHATCSQVKEKCCIDDLKLVQHHEIPSPRLSLSQCQHYPVADSALSCKLARSSSQFSFRNTVPAETTHPYNWMSPLNKFSYPCMGGTEQLPASAECFVPHQAPTKALDTSGKKSSSGSVPEEETKVSLYAQSKTGSKEGITNL